MHSRDDLHHWVQQQQQQQHQQSNVQVVHDPVAGDGSSLAASESPAVEAHLLPAMQDGTELVSMADEMAYLVW